MSNLSLVFEQNGTNTDGTAFDASQFAGIEVQVDGTPFASVPSAFAVDGKYSLTADITLADGDHHCTVRVKHVDGLVSDPSNVATFTVAPAPAVPSAPFGLSATYSR